ncbi:hypothetical protein [Streptomyces sp. NBC_00151]|nr:hypothetical protein [Streptomyces sp. NBC_00151]
MGIVSTGNEYCGDQHPVSVFTPASAITVGLGLPTA